MILIHILFALSLGSKPTVAHAWVPRRPMPMRPFRPGFAPGYRPPVFVPRYPTPFWWGARARIIRPWGGWVSYITPGMWQCEAFSPTSYGIGISPNPYQAQNTALLYCGGYNWQAVGCYVPYGYCQHYQ